MKVTSTLGLAVLLAVPLLVTVNSHAGGAAGSTAAGTSATASAPASEGEVRKVDLAAGKITIKHGTLENLGMPPMTMVFRAKDPASLKQVKVGDKITFVAEKIEGQFTATQVEVKK